MRKYKAALIGYYGFKNFGDELLLKASLDMLARAGIKSSEILILLREFNGLWTGLLLGLIITLCVKFILIPALKLMKPLFI